MGERGQAAYRTILISDLHLGSYRCDAASVLDFLAHHTADTLYLVGDIIDFWSFRRHSGWRADHLAVVRRLLDLARRGTRVVLVPGNHDEPLQHLAQLGLPGIEISRRCVLESAQGRRYLVTHGHEHDRLFGSTGALAAMLCGIGESIGLMTRGARRAPSRGDAEPGGSFEVAAARAARLLGYDGAICGHSHRPADFDIGGTHYLNCGDWLGNRTAVVEDHSGGFALLRWPAAAETFAETWDAAPVLAGALP